ncbi:MAG: hypothetical protein OEZ23_10235, partial [Gammaproteobacteria bacterium]|nr:hypothetical protein [Gammaproteobacteria bacterium]
TEHKAFSQYPEVGKERAKQILTLYGANHLVHGHTPIPIASHQPASMVNSAWTYADGLCTNVDGALYMGGPGFVYLLEA